MNKGFHVQGKAAHVGVNLHRTLLKIVQADCMDVAAGGQQTVFVEKPLISTKPYQHDWTTSSWLKYWESGTLTKAQKTSVYIK